MEIETIGLKLAKMPTEQAMLNIIVALVKQQGGEVRIPERFFRARREGESVVWAEDESNRAVIVTVKPAGMVAWILPSQQPEPETQAKTPPPRLRGQLNADDLAAAIAESQRIRMEHEESLDHRAR